MDVEAEQARAALLSARAGEPEADAELIGTLTRIDGDEFLIEVTADALIAQRSTPALRVLLSAWSSAVRRDDEDAVYAMEGSVSHHRGEMTPLADNSLAERCAELEGDPDPEVARAAWVWREWWLYSPQPEPSMAADRSSLRVRRLSRSGCPWPRYAIVAPDMVGSRPYSGTVTRTRRPRPFLRSRVQLSEVDVLLEAADHARRSDDAGWVGLAALRRA